MVNFHYRRQGSFLSWMISLSYLKPFSDFLFHSQWPLVSFSLAWYHVLLWSHILPSCPSLIHSSHPEDLSIPNPPGMLSSQGLWNCCALCLSCCFTLATLDKTLIILVYLFIPHLCHHIISSMKVGTFISFVCGCNPRTINNTSYMVSTLQISVELVHFHLFVCF